MFGLVESGCRKRWATFIGGLASFGVIFSTVGRRTVVGGARVVRRRPAGRSAGRPGGARVVSGADDDRLTSDRTLASSDLRRQAP